MTTPKIVAYYANLWATTVTQYAQFDIIYGWLAVASLVVAVLALLLAALRRADGIQAAGLVGQFFLVYAAPAIVAFFVP